MAGKLVKGKVDPMFERLGDLRRRAVEVTGEQPMFGRGMPPEEYERLLTESIKAGRLDPTLKRHAPTHSLVVD